MRYLMGDASTVYSLQQNLFHQETPDYTVEDVSGTVFGFANGGISTISATNEAIPGRWINDYRVVTQNVTAEFTDANHATLVHTGGASAEADRLTEIVTSNEDVYKLEFLDIFEAIHTDRPAKLPMSEGAKSPDLALVAARSAETGMPERIKFLSNVTVIERITCSHRAEVQGLASLVDR